MCICTIYCWEGVKTAYAAFYYIKKPLDLYHAYAELLLRILNAVFIHPDTNPLRSGSLSEGWPGQEVSSKKQCRGSCNTSIQNLIHRHCSAVEKEEGIKPKRASEIRVRQCAYLRALKEGEFEVSYPTHRGRRGQHLSAECYVNILNGGISVTWADLDRCFTGSHYGDSCCDMTAWGVNTLQMSLETSRHSTSTCTATVLFN